MNQKFFHLRLCSGDKEVVSEIFDFVKCEMLTSST